MIMAEAVRLLWDVPHRQVVFTIPPRIIDHLKLTFVAERPPPECAFQDLLVDPPVEYFP
jgi:hypothetical protein